MLRNGCVLWVAMAVCLVSHTAEAGKRDAWNTVSRKLGLGWSDGYHAYNGCDGSGWVQFHPGLPPGPVERVSPPVLERPEPTPAPAPRSASTRRTAQKRPDNEPVLPSQLHRPRPAYWTR